jgi:diguanylate cyclase (GGDEF)-like protein
MGKPLSLLIIEDSPDDVLLLTRALRRADFDLSYENVCSHEGIVQALDRRTFDLVISDHNMPGLTAPAALAVVRAHDSDVPFIIVSGSIGEEAAVAVMRAGAQDHISKNNLARLPAAIERELKDAEERRARRRAEEKVRHLAYHDPLTGLPNRAQLCESMTARLAQPHAPRLAALAIKLHNLKEIVNTLGFSIGQQMIVEMSQRLRSVSGSGLLSSLGHGEFSLVLTGDATVATEVAAAIQEVMQAPVAMGALALEAEVLVGVALFPEHGETPDLLLQHAAVALLQARDSAGRMALYSRAHDPNRPERLAMVAELRRAIEKNQLLLHYQPKVSFATGALVGVEALVRWNHPKLGLVPPDSFIPLAEQSGLINPLTLWVLEECVRQSERWQRSGLAVNVAVNLSAKNLQNVEVGERLLDLFSGASPLTLEVTESAIMTDEPRIHDLFHELKKREVAIAIDDFGTGYSSLTNLRRLPLSEIKIDKSFVSHMTDCEEDRTIVQSIIELAHNLGMHVVAEGIDSQATMDMLGALHCDLAQGYLLARPLTAGALFDWTQQRGAMPLQATGT